jgi:Domain of unknown function (DUF4333)
VPRTQSSIGRKAEMGKWLASVAVLAVSMALVACGGIDTDKLEDEVSSDAQQQVDDSGIDATVESVECPDDIESETGTEFECRLEFSDGTAAVANGEVTDGDNGDVEYSFTPVESGN